MPSPKIVQVVGGLCNRLRAVLSRPRPLTVIWEKDAYVDFGEWSDVFLPLQGVTFVEHGIADEREVFAPPANAASGWERGYSKLIPGYATAYWIQSLKQYIRAPYAAIHVRRTDHTPLSKEYKSHTADEVFDAFLAKLPKEMPVYLATDNAETQALYADKLGIRTVFAGPIRASSAEQAGDDHRRHTSLEHAVTDLFMCADAAVFQGSGYSSFTWTIDTLRHIRRSS